MTLDVSDATFDAEVLASPVPVIVEFWAPWCRPCRHVEPVLDALVAAAGGRVRLVRVDIDGNLRTPSRYGVLSIPTVILFAGGEPRATVAGAHPRRRFEQAFAGYLD